MTLIDWLISFILAFIMLAIGLSLQRRSFSLLLARPRAILFGMFLQLMVLPAIAFIVANAWELPPAFKAGIVILSACPGGLTSNFISYLLRANTTLAVSLTICNSLVSMLTIPLIINFGLLLFFDQGGVYALPFLPTAGRIFTIVLIPVLLGISYRAYYPKTAKRLQIWFRWTSMLLLGIVFLIKVFAPAESGGSALTIAEVALILPASLVVNFLALGAGRVLSGLFGFKRDDQLTLGVEIGIQNTSLAFLIAATLLQNDDMLKPALIYATFSFITAVIYGLLIKPEQWAVIRKEFSQVRQLFRREED